jgi:hypothetical protein
LREVQSSCDQLEALTGECTRPDLNITLLVADYISRGTGRADCMVGATHLSRSDVALADTQCAQEALPDKLTANLVHIEVLVQFLESHVEIGFLLPGSDGEGERVVTIRVDGTVVFDSDESSGCGAANNHGIHLSMVSASEGAGLAGVATHEATVPCGTDGDGELGASSLNYESHTSDEGRLVTCLELSVCQGLEGCNFREGSVLELATVGGATDGEFFVHLREVVLEVEPVPEHGGADRLELIVTGVTTDHVGDLGERVHACRCRVVTRTHFALEVRDIFGRSPGDRVGEEAIRVNDHPYVGGFIVGAVVDVGGADLEEGQVRFAVGTNVVQWFEVERERSVHVDDVALGRLRESDVTIDDVLSAISRALSRGEVSDLEAGSLHAVHKLASIGSVPQEEVVRQEVFIECDQGFEEGPRSGAEDIESPGGGERGVRALHSPDRLFSRRTFDSLERRGLLLGSLVGCTTTLAGLFWRGTATTNGGMLNVSGGFAMFDRVVWREHLSGRESVHRRVKGFVPGIIRTESRLDPGHAFLGLYLVRGGFTNGGRWVGAGLTVGIRPGIVRPRGRVLGRGGVARGGAFEQTPSGRSRIVGPTMAGLSLEILLVIVRRFLSVEKCRG